MTMRMSSTQYTIQFSPFQWTFLGSLQFIHGRCCGANREPLPQSLDTPGQIPTAKNFDAACCHANILDEDL